jgi:hypothetical protein
MLGLGFGGGWVHPTSNLADDYWGFATEFHIGGMINPRLAILFNTSSIYRWVGYDTTVWLHTDAFCLQFWVHDKVYLRAGGGFAFLQAADNWDGFLIDAVWVAPSSPASASSSCSSASSPSTFRCVTRAPGSTTSTPTAS